MKRSLKKCLHLSSLICVHMQRLFHKLFNIHYEVFRWFSLLITIFLIAWLMPGNVKFGYEYNLGKPWQHQTLIAPFDFAVQKSADRLRDEKDRVAAQVLPYFQFDEDLTEEASQQFLLKINSLDFTAEPDIEKARNTAVRLFEKVQQRGLLQHHTVLENRRPNQLLINVVRNKVVSQVSPEDLFTVVTAYQFCKRSLDTTSITMKK